MENITVITPSFANIQTALDTARNGLVGGLNKTGELVTNYANAMTYAFDMTLENGDIVAWFDLKGKSKKMVKAEYDKFVSALAEKGLEGNKYVYWQRVKEASGYVTAGNTAKASTTIDAKTLTELKTMINRILNAEDEAGSELSQGIKAQLMACFEDMGGVVDTLG